MYQFWSSIETEERGAMIRSTLFVLPERTDSDWVAQVLIRTM